MAKSKAKTEAALRSALRDARDRLDEFVGDYRARAPSADSEERIRLDDRLAELRDDAFYAAEDMKNAGYSAPQPRKTSGSARGGAIRRERGPTGATIWTAQGQRFYWNGPGSRLKLMFGNSLVRRFVGLAPRRRRSRRS